MSFKASKTENIIDFEGIPSLVEIMVKEYSKSFEDHSFSFRIILPRSIMSKNVNSLTKKLCIQIQNSFLVELKKLKLKPNIREVRYIHDNDHFGWLLVDPYIYDSL